MPGIPIKCKTTCCHGNLDGDFSFWRHAIVGMNWSSQGCTFRFTFIFNERILTLHCSFSSKSILFIPLESKGSLWKDSATQNHDECIFFVVRASHNSSIAENLRNVKYRSCERTPTNLHLLQDWIYWYIYQKGRKQDKQAENKYTYARQTIEHMWHNSTAYLSLCWRKQNPARLPLVKFWFHLPRPRFATAFIATTLQ